MRKVYRGISPVKYIITERFELAAGGALAYDIAQT